MANISIDKYLSKRQMTILRLFGSGLTRREIADQLGIKENGIGVRLAEMSSILSDLNMFPVETDRHKLRNFAREFFKSEE